MTSKTKQQIKAFFETGDKPTESQFIDFIDSYVDKSGPLGALETAVSGGGSGFVYASAGDADIIDASTALSRLGATVVTTAAAIQAVAGVYTTTAQAASLVGTYRGAVVYNSTDQTISTGTATVLTFDSEAIDTDAIHSTSSNTGRMTVPAGVTKIRLIAQVLSPDTGTVSNRNLSIYKNGVAIVTLAIPRDTFTTPVGTGGSSTLNLVTPALSCVATDYFEAVYNHTAGSSIPAYAGQTWFEMEILA